MIIVTGGAGFIGSALVAGLNQRGQDDILIVDVLGTDNRWMNLRKLKYADYIEADDFFEILATGQTDWDVQAIIHMGACSDTTESDATFLVNNNYGCSKLLANWAATEGIRFIYASSAATYGDGEKGFADNQDKLNELLPLNMYGYSKHMFDLWAKRAGLLDTIVGLKFFNVFGPNEYHKAHMSSFIIKAFEQINDHGKVGLFKSYHPDYKDGCQERDFLYVKDAVDMTLFFLDNPTLAGIYNIGTGVANNWNDLANATFDAMGQKPNIKYIEMPEHLKDKYQYYTKADIGKIRKVGYDKSITTLQDAIKDYVQNYLQKNEFLGA